MENEISITVVATGFSQPNDPKLIGGTTGAVDLGALYKGVGNNRNSNEEISQDVARFWGR